MYCPAPAGTGRRLPDGGRTGQIPESPPRHLGRICLHMHISPHHSMTPRQRRRRARAIERSLPRVPDAGANFGYRAVELPPGTRVLPPLARGDQGISPSERRQADRVISSLLRAGGVNWVATYRPDTGLYELIGRRGTVRWQRLATPDGHVAYQVHSIDGENPVPSVDGRTLTTLEEEVAAAGGTGKPVPESRTSYPDILQRLSQLWDDKNAPDLVYIPSGAGDPNHPGAGSHGIPDATQSRAPLIIAGPGVRQGEVVDSLVKNVDVAPTVAEYLGVRPIIGTNASGVGKAQMLKWQDGSSIASAIGDARVGASVHGAAQRAVVFVLDGASQTVMMDEVRKGHLPNIARLMRMGVTMRNGSISDYPTVTWANHNSLMTGASPGHSGLINNSWYNRDTGTEQLITDGGQQNGLRTGRLMNPQVETIYEAVRRTFGKEATSLALNQPSGRGATISILDLAGIGKLVANLPGILMRYREGQKTSMDQKANANGEYHTVSWQDNIAIAIAQTMWKKRNPPKLTVFELALTDTMGHINGPQSPQSRTAMQEADRNVGRMLDEVQRQGYMGSTMFVLTADHGMEHQSTDPKELGGWYDALRTSGVKTVESTRFVYIKNVQWSVHGATPQAGTTSTVAVRVINDDQRGDGVRPAVAGASVRISDGRGHTWVGHTDATGVAHVEVSPADAGSLTVKITHPGFTEEAGTIPVTGSASGSAHPVKRARPRRR